MYFYCTIHVYVGLSDFDKIKCMLFNIYSNFYYERYVYNIYMLSSHIMRCFGLCAAFDNLFPYFSYNSYINFYLRLKNHCRKPDCFLK